MTNVFDFALLPPPREGDITDAVLFRKFLEMLEERLELCGGH
jgi:hypothetical protein